MTHQPTTYLCKRSSGSACDHYEENCSAKDNPTEFRHELRHAITQAIKGMRTGDGLARLLLPDLRRTALLKLLAVGLAPGRAQPLAEDVAHDVFMELFKKDAKVLRRWTEKACKGDPRGYFRLIAKRRAIDAWKKNRKIALVDDLDMLSKPTTAPSIERVLSARSCFEKTLRSRRDADAAGELAYDILVSGVSQAALADELGISASAIYQRTKRFRRDFTNAWHDDETIH